jgi:hypothetical protein
VQRMNCGRVNGTRRCLRHRQRHRHRPRCWWRRWGASVGIGHGRGTGFGGRAAAPLIVGCFQRCRWYSVLLLCLCESSRPPSRCCWCVAAGVHAASITLPTTGEPGAGGGAGEKTLMEEMMEQAVAANRKAAAEKRQRELAESKQFGAGLSGGFFGGGGGGGGGGGAGGSSGKTAAAASSAPSTTATAPVKAVRRCGACARLESDVKAAGLKFLLCSRCKRVGYCSVECQKSHWSGGHRAECGKVRCRAAMRQGRWRVDDDDRAVCCEGRSRR